VRGKKISNLLLSESLGPVVVHKSQETPSGVSGAVHAIPSHAYPDRALEKTSRNGFNGANGQSARKKRLGWTFRASV